MSFVVNGLSISNNISGNGIDIRNAVRAASTVAGTLTTSFENSDIIDGVTLATNDRILIKDQTTATENGIYIVQATGAPVRATDFETGSSAASIIVFISEGTTNANTGWVCTNNNGSDVVGTDNLAFSKFSNDVNDVAGPSSATDNAIAKFNGTGGKTIQNSGVAIDDSNNMSGIGNITLSGTVDGVDVSAHAAATTAHGVSGSIVGTSDTQTLTNKTINASNNTITLTTSKFIATATTSTTSTTYVLLNSMTTTPDNGTYMVTFSASGLINGVDALGNYALHAGGTIIQHSERDNKTNSTTDITTLHTQDIITVDGTEAIEVKYKTASNTFTVYSRSLILIKMG